MRFARAGWAAAAAVLLAAGGCDYWDNLVDNKTLTRADLEVKVVDAWTGEALAGAACRDSLQAVTATTDEQGVFRLLAGATGQYAITCSHEWYYDGAVNIHLTRAGAHAVAKLARRGEAENWYPELYRQVHIPRPDEGVRFPTDLDWQVMPFDTTRHFRYEWTFRVAKALNHGHLNRDEQLDSESFSPRFRTRATEEKGVQEGMDTAILTVYSLLNGGQTGYPVGSDTMPFAWIRNIKPNVKLDSGMRLRYIQAGCDKPGIRHFESIHFAAGDPDGGCDSIRFWTINAPTVQTLDTLLPCSGNQIAKIQMIPPRPGADGIPNPDGSYDYYDLFSIEITDKNGEKAQDTLTLRTHNNIPPSGWGRLLDPNPTSTYLEGDSLAFEVQGHDTDGGVERMDLIWTRDKVTTIPADPWFTPNESHNSTYQWTESFTAGSYSSEAWIIDNCEDSIPATILPNFTVVKNTPPLFVISRLISPTSPGGDSLMVSFELTVTDADKGRGDILTQVRVFWTNNTYEQETSPTTPFTKVGGYHHAYPLPSAGSSIPVRIQAEDNHSGVSDTTINVQPL